MKNNPTTGELKSALELAAGLEYSDVPEPEALVYDYCFSEEFEAKIRKITQSASKSYVSVGRRRVRRAMVACLAAVMVLATAIVAVAVQKIVVTWNETHNEKAGTLDVTFDIDDPNGWTTGEGFTCIKPEAPAGFEIFSEEKSEEIYYVKYENKSGDYIDYYQEGSVGSMGLSIDSENNEFQPIQINGHDGYFSSKYGINALIWSDGVYLFDISGTCDPETLYEMAENVV